MLTKLTIFRNNKNFNVCFEHFWHTVFEAFCILFGEVDPTGALLKFGAIFGEGVWRICVVFTVDGKLLYMLLYLVLNAVAIAYNNSNIILHFSQRALSRPTHTHLLGVGMFVVVRVCWNFNSYICILIKLQLHFPFKRVSWKMLQVKRVSGFPIRKCNAWLEATAKDVDENDDIFR